jgi:enoyl-CoA hydratase/carnithine racemase
MSTHEFENLDWEFDEGSGIGRITLDRPDALNALSTPLCEEVVEAFEAFAELDDEADGVAVRAVVVSGAGRAFSAGADVNEFAEGRTVPFDVYEAASGFEAPVVAKIDGYCLGGGLVIALDCDFRFASDRSEFGLPEVGLGILASGGGIRKLAAAVGPDRARELAVTGERFSAERAGADGLLTGRCPADELDDRVESFVGTVAAQPPLAVRATLDLAAFGQADDGARLYERRLDRRLRRSADHEAAVDAFLDDEAGEPSFEGR